jgi:serine/threonine-protein kinase
MTGGGDDTTTAPVVPAKKQDKPKAKKKASQPAQAAPQTNTAPATATGEAPTASTGSNPAVGSRLHNQAFQLANQGKYDEAIALERKAIPMLEGSSGLDYWYALYNLGHALRLAGHPDEAIPILEKRLQNPNQRGTVQAELDKAKQEAAKG